MFSDCLFAIAWLQCQRSVKHQRPVKQNTTSSGQATTKDREWPVFELAWPSVVTWPTHTSRVPLAMQESIDEEQQANKKPSHWSVWELQWSLKWRQMVPRAVESVCRKLGQLVAVSFRREPATTQSVVAKTRLARAMINGARVRLANLRIDRIYLPLDVRLAGTSRTAWKSEMLALGSKRRTTAEMGKRFFLFSFSFCVLGLLREINSPSSKRPRM